MLEEINNEKTEVPHELVQDMNFIDSNRKEIIWEIELRNSLIELCGQDDVNLKDIQDLYMLKVMLIEPQEWYEGDEVHKEIIYRPILGAESKLEAIDILKTELTELQKELESIQAKQN